MVDGCCNTSWCCYIFDQEPSQVSMINCTFTSRMTKTRFCGCGSWLNLWGLISSKRFNGGKRMFIISRPMNEYDTTLWYCNESFQRMFLIVCRIVVPWRFCETQSSCLLRNLTAIIAYLPRYIGTRMRARRPRSFHEAWRANGNMLTVSESPLLSCASDFMSLLYCKGSVLSLIIFNYPYFSGL